PSPASRGGNNAEAVKHSLPCLRGRAGVGAAVLSRNLRQLVDDAELFRRGVFREARPGAARYLAAEEVAAGIDGEAVGRSKFPGQHAAMRLAEPGHDLALQRVDADPRADIRPILVDLARRTAFPDIAQGVGPMATIGAQTHAVRAVQVVP